jgi:hypothetical protein
MNVTHDIIAAVTGPGWKFGLSRILINDQGLGVVFIAGSEEPYASFAVQNVSTGRGAGVTEDGNITWRRRGSSCQYKLAKCKISTETMTQRWEDWTEPHPEPEETGIEDVDLPDEDVPDGSASVVMSWVGDDTDRARAALDVENEGKQRVGLTADLEKMLAAEELL